MGLAAISACFLAVTTAAADPSTTIPDPPARRTDPRVGPDGHKSSANLDGTYVWIGPTGAAGRIDDTWDSLFGADLAIVRVREREGLAVLGATLGASRWTERGGGRIWLDAIVGTRVGRTFGVSGGPILELAELAHPRLGMSLGVWAFAGVTPFARVGVVDELGGFAELGLHIALPVLRR